LTGDNIKGAVMMSKGRKEGRKKERKQEKAAAQFGGAVQNRPFYKLTQQLYMTRIQAPDWEQ
jgi:hypothetical protein